MNLYDQDNEPGIVRFPTSRDGFKAGSVGLGWVVRFVTIFVVASILSILPFFAVFYVGFSVLEAEDYISHSPGLGNIVFLSLAFMGVADLLTRKS